jgi:hypothetical protein
MVAAAGVWLPPKEARRVVSRHHRVTPPSGWASPRARKAIDIYCRITITIIKILIAIL